MTIATTAIRLLAGAALITSAAAFAQNGAPTRIRGDIVAVDKTTLTVKRRGSGDIVKIQPHRPFYFDANGTRI